jgi:hypothetical protein
MLVLMTLTMMVSAPILCIGGIISPSTWTRRSRRCCSSRSRRSR